MRNLIPALINSFPDLNRFLPYLFQFVNELAKVKTGSYTGTGSALNVFTELNPIFVLVLDEGSAVPVAWFDGLTANTSKQMDGSTFTDAILGPTDTRDGFKIGTNADVNTNTTVYFYIAIGTK